jgi:hypothetical protein
MRILLFVGLLVVAIAEPAGANEVGRIAIFSDEALTDPYLLDDGYRQVDIYVGHVDHYGVTGSQFMIQVDPGFTGHYLGETSPWSPIVIGTAMTGMSVSYAQCAVADLIVVKLTFFLSGTSSPCSGLSVVGHPDSYTGDEICVGCSFVEIPCDPPGALQVNCTVPVESTTWGRVKALYR